MDPVPSYSHLLVQGEDLRFTIQLKDENGQVIPLTGYSAKYGFSNLGGTVIFSAIPTVDDVGNVITLSVPGSTTKTWNPGDYIHEFRVKDASGVEDVLFRGTLKVQKAVVTIS